MRPISFVLALLLAALALDPATQAALAGGPPSGQIVKGQQPMPSPLKRIGFERSGGFYHQPIGGAVVFHGGVAEIASDFTGGSRPATEAELRQLQALDLAAIGASSFVLRGGRAPLGPPEGYQYDVTIETADGARLALRFHEEPPDLLDRAAPGLGGLASWVRREVAALWRQKAGTPPAPG